MKNYLFITSELTRGIIALATTMSKNDTTVTIVSPAEATESSRLRIPHIQIKKSKFLGKIKLSGGADLKNFQDMDNLSVYVLDLPSLSLATKYKLNVTGHVSEFGIDLSIFNPGAVAPLLQNRVLDELNIAPHQKLITVISPVGFNIDVLIEALNLLRNDDIAIALYGNVGNVGNVSVNKLVRVIEKSGHHITYIGGDQDIVSTLRSSYAVLSLGKADPVLLMAACAMGRPTVWGTNDYAIDSNIHVASPLRADALAAALDNVLNLSPSARAKIEKENILYAKKFDIHNVIKKLK